MKLHHRVIEDLIVDSGDPADLSSRSTTVTKSGWLDTKHGPGPKDLAQDDLQEFTQELARTGAAVRTASTEPTMVG